MKKINILGGYVSLGGEVYPAKNSLGTVSIGDREYPKSFEDEYIPEIEPRLTSEYLETRSENFYEE